MLAVFRRELRAYFNSYIGFTFHRVLPPPRRRLLRLLEPAAGSPNYTGVLGSLTFVFLFLVPILTMRLLSEETRQKTDQLLITSPLSITGIVIGKYLAAVGVFLITLIITVLYPVIMSFFALGGLGWSADPRRVPRVLPPGLLFHRRRALLLLPHRQPITAAVISFAALLFIWILDPISQGLPADPVRGPGVPRHPRGTARAADVLQHPQHRGSRGDIRRGGRRHHPFVRASPGASFDGLIGRILSWFSLLKRYGDFSLGLLGLGPIVYYLSFCGAFVFLAIRMIEKRRWA